LNQPNDQIH